LALVLALLMSLMLLPATALAAPGDFQPSATPSSYGPGWDKWRPSFGIWLSDPDGGDPVRIGNWQYDDDLATYVDGNGVEASIISSSANDPGYPYFYSGLDMFAIRLAVVAKGMKATDVIGYYNANRGTNPAISQENYSDFALKFSFSQTTGADPYLSNDINNPGTKNWLGWDESLSGTTRYYYPDFMLGSLNSGYAQIKVKPLGAGSAVPAILAVTSYNDRVMNLPNNMNILDDLNELEQAKSHLAGIADNVRALRSFQGMRPSDPQSGVYGADNTEVNLGNDSSYHIGSIWITLPSDGYPAGQTPEPEPDVDTSWYNAEDTLFTLTSKAQFLGFAAIVNNKAATAEAGAVAGINPEIPADDFLGKTVKLAVDVDLGGIQTSVGGFNENGQWQDPVWTGNEWLPIASYTSSGAHTQGSGDGIYGRPFKGVFDGGFHKITNIYVPYSGSGDDTPEGNSHGLFGDLGQAGIVKNVIIQSGYIKGARFTGGIVGRNWGGVENSANYASIQANGRGGGGGIVGVNYDNGHDPYVLNCVNYGQIYNSKALTAGSPYPGGIVAGNEGKIENCLNVGKVGSGGVAFGGLIGDRRGAGSAAVNSYFLNTTATNLTGSGTSTVDALSGAKTEAEIKSQDFAAQLGPAFVYVEGDWPQLATEVVVPPTVGAPGSGDLDGDGIVTVAEAMQAAQAVVSGAGLSPEQIAAMDIDGDGLLTMADVILAIRLAAGL
jgi:hypothetical protein